MYAQSLRDNLQKIRVAREGLNELSIGGTAVGTGITTEPLYDVNIVKRLRKETGLPLFPSHRKMLHTSHMTVFQHYSNALSELSSDLLIWINDWVLLGSDPYAGVGEIHLPEVEPGSSIMPAKVNPSILEALKMIVLQVQGNNETIRLCCESTQLELNVMTPVMGGNLFESQELLANGLRMFREKCLTHVCPPADASVVDASMSTATALNPYLGYDGCVFSQNPWLRMPWKNGSNHWAFFRMRRHSSAPKTDFTQNDTKLRTAIQHQRCVIRNVQDIPADVDSIKKSAFCCMAHRYFT